MTIKNSGPVDEPALYRDEYATGRKIGSPYSQVRYAVIALTRFVSRETLRAAVFLCMTPF
jgi:hypothetical protein